MHIHGYICICNHPSNADARIDYGWNYSSISQDSERTAEKIPWSGRSGQRKWSSRIRIVALGWGTDRVYLILFSSLESRISMHTLDLWHCIWDQNWVLIDLIRTLSLMLGGSILFSNQVTAALNEIDILYPETRGKGEASFANMIS